MVGNNYKLFTVSGIGIINTWASVSPFFEKNCIEHAGLNESCSSITITLVFCTPVHCSLN